MSDPDAIPEFDLPRNLHSGLILAEQASTPESAENAPERNVEPTEGIPEMTLVYDVNQTL